MGKKWIHRLKKEDFAHVAQRLNVALEGRLEDMRRALSEYYSETENDPQLVDIWAELEATRRDTGQKTAQRTSTATPADTLPSPRGAHWGAQERRGRHALG